ncbi:MAG: hypothetical protein HYX83_03310, partial [Chloroflexi bacterium]|nr:hypothetical protein [Chloroflexota bacterium]
MSQERYKLTKDSRVAIVGGGPAGSFFALYLMHYARERGIQTDITIYQGRDFAELGPKGCKGCAGILSISLLRNLRELNLVIPDNVIRGKIERYSVHSPFLSITISNPEKDVEIASVYRGGGPRVSHFEQPISFDDWLLSEARNRGARVEHKTVSGIYLGDNARIEVQGQKLEYDLIVLASGINGRPTQVYGPGYTPPKTLTMAQDELYLG